MNEPLTMAFGSVCHPQTCSPGSPGVCPRKWVSPALRPPFVLSLTLALFCSWTQAQQADDIFENSFDPTCPGSAPGVTLGAGSGLLLRGTVVTPATAFVGEVLVIGDTIACAAASCAGQPGAGDASIVETKGLIFPGLIDTDNISLFDIFDENDWTPPLAYTNHNQWPNDAKYGALIDAKQYLNGETSVLDLGCEMDKYGELKALIAGSTSIVSRATTANRACYGSLTRTIDQTPNDLGADHVQVATLFPSTSAADAVCSNFASNSTHAYLIDIAEGTDATALSEFTTLGTITTVDGCLYAPQTAIVHGTALGDAQFTTVAAAGMSLVWSPRSDITLYGQTANIPLARSKGINVALGSHWSITGSHNLLSALRYADQIDNASWGDVLTASDLVEMVTTHAAKTLGLGDVLGSIEVGKKADLTVVKGTCEAPWADLVKAGSRDIRLVMVGGIPLYGDTSLQAAAPANPGCESLDVCGLSKFVCVAESGGTASNKFGQTLTDISSALSDALGAYDALNLTPYAFSPIAPLADCQ